MQWECDFRQYLYRGMLIESLLKSSEQNIQKLLVLEQKFETISKHLNKYNFVQNISNSTAILFVGEGNFSFSCSIAEQTQNCNDIITSTNERYSEISDFGRENLLKLKKLAVQILCELDATKLHKIFDNTKFEIIIFQFPNVASRETINGYNPNYILVKDFLISASKILTKNGRIVVTVVDSDYYNNIFKFEELSEMLGLPKPKKYNFNPQDYPQFQHTMTHEDAGCLDNYNKFTTYEFTL